MTDHVNDFLARHPDRVRPRLYTADGHSLSVQASDSHYCSPRDNAGPYSSVEVGFPLAPDGKTTVDPAFASGSREEDIWPWVSVRDVNAWIDAHGGPQQRKEK